MSILHHHDSQLCIEDVKLEAIAAKFGTPCYVYSHAAIQSQYQAFDQAFQPIPHRICYAVKANSNLSILKLLADMSCGFDIVSAGELERVLAAGGKAAKIVFSGVGKRRDEIERAIDAGIYCFNVESIPEIERIQSIADLKNTIVNIALRVNPDVDAKTHAHISTGMKENKFGIDFPDIIPICEKLADMPSISLIGIACHIGSQITDLAPFLTALDQLLAIHTALKSMGVNLRHLDIGGGLGIQYHHEQPPAISVYADSIKHKLAEFNGEIIIEPGRAIIGGAGILLTRVEYLKHTRHKNFAVVDAGMNDLLRPALYDAWQTALPVHDRHGESLLYDIVGPLCESADTLGKNRRLHLQAGDLLAIDCVGAYGFSMSSNYNSRCRPAEILVHEDQMKLIRRRESIQDLFSLEQL